MNPNEAQKSPQPKASASTVTPAQVKPEMKVLCAKDGQLGLVDHMQGASSIKLKKDDKGVHHYIPLSWVTRADDKLHLDRPGEQAMREWSTEAPKN